MRGVRVDDSHLPHPASECRTRCCHDSLTSSPRGDQALDTLTTTTSTTLTTTTTMATLTATSPFLPQRPSLGDDIDLLMYRIPSSSSSLALSLPPSPLPLPPPLHELKSSPSRRRLAHQQLPRSDSPAGSSSTKRMRKMRSNIEDSLLEERLKVANEVLPEDNLEDLMHLPIAPELLSRRHRAREASSTHRPLGLAAFHPPPSPTPTNILDDYFVESNTVTLPRSSFGSVDEARQQQTNRTSTPPSDSSTSKIPISRICGQSLSKSLGAQPVSQTRIPFNTPSPFPIDNDDDDEVDSSYVWEVLQSVGGTSPQLPTLPSAPPRRSVSSSNRSSLTQTRLPRKSTTQKIQKPVVSVQVPNAEVRPRPRAMTNQLGVGHAKKLSGSIQPVRKASQPRNGTIPTSTTFPNLVASGSATTTKVVARAPIVATKARAVKKGVDATRPRSLSFSSVATDGQLPPWLTDQGPRLYRVDTSSPPTKFGSSPVQQYSPKPIHVVPLSQQRHDDLILPTVARKLERQMLQEDQQRDADGNEWSTSLDGLERVQFGSPLPPPPLPTNGVITVDEDGNVRRLKHANVSSPTLDHVETKVVELPMVTSQMNESTLSTTSGVKGSAPFTNLNRRSCSIPVDGEVNGEMVKKSKEVVTEKVGEDDGGGQEHGSKCCGCIIS